MLSRFEPSSESETVESFPSGPAVGTHVRSPLTLAFKFAGADKLWAAEADGLVSCRLSLQFRTRTLPGPCSMFEAQQLTMIAGGC